MIDTIVLHGHDEVGKSSTAQALADALNARGLRVIVASLGAAIRQDVHRLGYAAWKKPTPAHLREILRAHGEGARAEHGTDYWIDRLEESLATAEANGMDCDVLIVDDCRQAHEYLHYTSMPSTAFVSLTRRAKEPRRYRTRRELARLFPALSRFIPRHPAIVEAVWDVRDTVSRWEFQNGSTEWVQAIDGLTPDSVAYVILERLDGQLPREARPARPAVRVLAS